MPGLVFEDSSPPVAAPPVRTDVACFVGIVRARASLADFQLRLPRRLRALGWRPTSAPASGSQERLPAMPERLAASRFTEWLRSGTAGWTQVSPVDPTPPRGGSRVTSPADLFEACLAAVLPVWLARWFAESAWFSPFAARTVREIVELEDVPVPIESWDAFNRLFEWERRPLNRRTGVYGDTALGAAVRSFFAQGGRKCYVVATGAPDEPSGASPRIADRLLPRVAPTPLDPATWRGAGCLLGLPDVSFLGVPDLPEAFRANPAPPRPAPPPESPEEFVECSHPATFDEDSARTRAFRAPRCDTAGFQGWTRKVEEFGRFLARECREVQLVVALPIPVVDADVPETFPARSLYLHRSAEAQWAEVARLRTAFVQVAYPWLRPSGGSRLPEGLESPDGTLVGLLAGNALSRGTQRSALNLPVRGIAGVEPVLTRSELEGFLPDTGASSDSRPRLQRLSAFGPTTTGIRLLSDVTTSPDRAWAPGQVNRLMSAIIRASRVAGEALLFENSGEDLWAAVTETLESVLEGFWREGAFAGDSTRDAFDVRCDRRTITQADIDAGRVIARIEFTPAAALDRITVLFSLQEGGHLSLLGRDPGSSMEAGE